MAVGNTKKFVVKNGLRTQNIDFVSPDSQSVVTQSISNNGVLSFDGVIEATSFGGVNAENVDYNNSTSGLTATDVQAAIDEVAGGAGGGAGGGGGAEISSTPPSSPTAGDLWWDSSEGTLYIYYNDGDSQQWVISSPALPGPVGPEGPAGAEGPVGPVGNVSSSDNVEINSLGVGTTASGTTGQIRATGDIVAHFSDDRLKTRLGNIENAVDKINTLSTFYYEPNETAQNLGYESHRYVGLSAQEVQEILPEVIKPAPIDDKYLTIQYEKLVPLLVAAIKEQQKEIDNLKSMFGEIK